MIVPFAFAKAINCALVMAFLEATKPYYSYYCLYNSSSRQDAAVRVYRGVLQVSVARF